MNFEDLIWLKILFLWEITILLKRHFFQNSFGENLVGAEKG